MTKRLEETFNLPELEEELEETSKDIAKADNDAKTIESALTISDKINSAFKEIKGMEDHDEEMDAIAELAVKAHRDLLSLGLNVQDMAAGSILTSSAAMLKLGLDAKDSKVDKKLKQIRLMVEKAKLDLAREKANAESGGEIDSGTNTQEFDRNELIQLLREDEKDE